MLKHMLGSVLMLGAIDSYTPGGWPMPMLHNRISHGPTDRYPVSEMRRRGLAWAGDGVEPEGAGESARKRKAAKVAKRTSPEHVAAKAKSRFWRRACAMRQQVRSDKPWVWYASKPRRSGNMHIPDTLDWWARHPSFEAKPTA
jgi:hypothetical protein